MFENCSSLITLNLSNFNTSSVTDMSYMFENCSSLTSLDLSNFNTSSVTDMSNMFENCSSLTSIDLSSFNTSNVTDMDFMFSGCDKLQTQINIMNADTSHVRMFTDALTDPAAYVILGYTTDTQSIAESMKSYATYPTKITLKAI